MASSVIMMPSGSKIFTIMPDLLFIPEFVFGRWTLVASTEVDPANPQGWVMFVSLFCFLITTLWFLIFITGINQSSIWPSLVMALIVTLLYGFMQSSLLSDGSPLELLKSNLKGKHSFNRISLPNPR